MNLKSLSDRELLDRTENLVREERELLTSVLHHLREIDRRRLYCTLGFGSLFQYAVQKLGYSEDQANRRIAAIRLIKELPEIEEKISSGKISLTNIGMARTLFRKEQMAKREFSKEQKLELLQSLENKPVKEAAKVIAGISPEALNPDKIRPISADKIEFKFTADERVQNKLEKLKGVLAHSHPNISLGELVDKLCDLGLEKWDKTAASRDLLRHKPNSKAEIQRQVWRRDKSCVNCGSSYALEQDHKIPKAQGGPDTADNLRVLCRKCNQRSAIEQFGQYTMDKYLSSPISIYNAIDRSGQIKTRSAQYS